MYIYVKTWCIGVPYCTCMVSICGSCICKVRNSQDLHCCINNWNSPLYTYILISSLQATLMHPWSRKSFGEGIACCVHAGEVYPAWEEFLPCLVEFKGLALLYMIRVSLSSVWKSESTISSWNGCFARYANASVAAASTSQQGSRWHQCPQFAQDPSQDHWLSRHSKLTSCLFHWMQLLCYSLNVHGT